MIKTSAKGQWVSNKPDMATASESVDVLLVGGGIVSATLAAMIQRVHPEWSLRVFERLDGVAKESSNGWNNAGTGHAALCELNYTPEAADGSVNIDKAIKIHSEFMTTKTFWGSLVREGALQAPNTFINNTPHMSFVMGEANQKFLRERHRLMSAHPFFADMEHSEDYAQIEKWSPLLIEGREPGQKVAATYAPGGTDVDFGAVTCQLFDDYVKRGGVLELKHEVVDIQRNADKTWNVAVKDLNTGATKVVRTGLLLVGAGGYTLKLLRKAGVPEVKGYGLFPVSGTFLSTDNPAVTDKHATKVYGKAAEGAPPMSMPHLDARIIDGQRTALFGPFAGLIPKFLKEGSVLDLFASLRGDNLLPIATAGLDNLGLTKVLAADLIANQAKRIEALHDFAPSMRSEDWKLFVAGQRAQIIKPSSSTKGTLQFGTEVITSAEGTISGVLGASPGASTAVPIALNILKGAFANDWEHWKSELSASIPALSIDMLAEPERALELEAAADETLNLPKVK